MSYFNKIPQPGQVIAGRYQIEKVVSASNTIYYQAHAVNDFSKKVQINVETNGHHYDDIQTRNAHFMGMSLSDARITKVYERINTPETVLLVRENVEGMSLRDLLKIWEAKNVSFAHREDLGKRIIFDALLALVTLNRNRVAHLNICPENISVIPNSFNEIDTLSPHIKLSGFENSNFFSKNNDGENSGFPLLDAYKHPSVLKSRFNATQYKWNGPECDLWSVAVMAFEIVTGSLPFPELEHLFTGQISLSKQRLILERLFPDNKCNAKLHLKRVFQRNGVAELKIKEALKALSPEFVSFVQKYLCPSYTQRAEHPTTVFTALHDPWFASLGINVDDYLATLYYQTRLDTVYNIPDIIPGTLTGNDSLIYNCMNSEYFINTTKSRKMELFASHHRSLNIDFFAKDDYYILARLFAYHPTPTQNNIIWNDNDNILVKLFTKRKHIRLRKLFSKLRINRDKGFGKPTDDKKESVNSSDNTLIHQDSSPIFNANNKKWKGEAAELVCKLKKVPANFKKLMKRVFM